MIVDSTNPRIMADNIRELAKNGGGGGGSDLPDVTIADNGKVLGVVEGSWNKMDAPSGVSHYKVTSGSIEGTFAEVLADLTAGKLVCIDVYADGVISETYFRDGLFSIEEETITELGFYTISNKIEKAILSSDGSFTISRTYPLAIDYSTTEQNTGRKWIDGRDIYRKTIVYNGPFTANTSIPHLISDIGLVINSYGLWVSNEGKDSHPLPMVGDTFNYTFSIFAIDSTNISLVVGSSVRSAESVIITMEYIKATATRTKKKTTTKGEN